MVIAFVSSITLLPALLAVLNPPAEPHPMGFSALAPVDRFLDRHRVGVIVTTVLVVLLGSPLLLYLPFDSTRCICAARRSSRSRPSWSSGRSRRPAPMRST
jgi:uncharacterized membrane protein YdfJ with MMPL/SSD domain